MFFKQKFWSKRNTRVRKILMYLQSLHNMFSLGDPCKCWETGKVEEAPGVLCRRFPWWFQDPGGPMVGIAGGIVANIPSLGHTKSPAECPSVARIFVRMMVRWDKQTLWVVPPPPWQLCRIIYCGFRLWRCDHSNAGGDNFMVYLVQDETSMINEWTNCGWSRFLS